MYINTQCAQEVRSYSNSRTAKSFNIETVLRPIYFNQGVSFQFRKGKEVGNGIICISWKATEACADRLLY